MIWLFWIDCGWCLRWWCNSCWLWIFLLDTDSKIEKPTITIATSVSWLILCKFDCTFDFLVFGETVWSWRGPFKRSPWKVKCLHVWAVWDFSSENADWLKIVSARFSRRSDHQRHLKIIVHDFALLNRSINQVRIFRRNCNLEVIQKLDCKISPIEFRLTLFG